MVPGYCFFSSRAFEFFFNFYSNGDTYFGFVSLKYFQAFISGIFEIGRAVRIGGIGTGGIARIELLTDSVSVSGSIIFN